MTTCGALIARDCHRVLCAEVDAESQAAPFQIAEDAVLRFIQLQIDQFAGALEVKEHAASLSCR